MTAGATPILEARGLGKSYRRGGGLLGRGALRPAFRQVSLRLVEGGTTALVGASGAGKSSLARCLALLEEPDHGQLFYRGTGHRRLGREQRARFRSEIQLVFQDAARAFNPRWSARRALEEPLRLRGHLSNCERRRRGAELAGLVGLEPETLDRRAREFSGGQLRRLNLARALSVEPRVLLLDEPFAGLDVSLQAQIANLLARVQDHLGLTCLYISHDLAMVAQLADQVAVLDRGRLVESGSAAEVLRRPAADATRELIAAGAALGLGASGPGL